VSERSIGDLGTFVSSWRYEVKLGGVNHCSLHCRLAKFRGLMIRVKDGAVIGLTEPRAWAHTKKTRFSANHSAVFKPRLRVRSDAEALARGQLAELHFWRSRKMFLYQSNSQNEMGVS